MINRDIQPHILLVDDDLRLRTLLRKYLVDRGYAVSEAASAKEARALLSLLQMDLMVLDIMMPEETGLELATNLSPQHRPPILMLTAMDTPDDRILGLETGAEDYLTKPFEPRELVLRLNNILRNHTRRSQHAQQIAFGDYVYDLTSQQLTHANEPVYLTSTETALLGCLAAQPGEIISREKLATLLGGEDTSRSVDVQIGRLRKKIEEDSARPRYIQTVRGEGYRLLAGG